MKRAALYSSASKSGSVSVEDSRLPDALVPEIPDSSLPLRQRVPRFISAYRIPLLVIVGLLAILTGAVLDRGLTEPSPVITQRDIDEAVRQSLEKTPLPAQAARASAAIQPSVVRVMGYDHPTETQGQAKSRRKPSQNPGKSEDEKVSIGSGVVITENGAILSSLHVVSGARRITVTFHDGSESAAEISGVDVDNDLVVLKAKILPDDLQPATLITTGDLKPGDDVVAVGFPFGFGPSVSAGVVSGLKREFESTEGKRVLSNLIQFDAAVNPGNSGGPLVNTKGEVLGIVTAIFNPVEQRFFVGLGFAVPIENAAAAVGISPF